MDVLARNNVTQLGNGKQVLLFAHGFGCDQTMWRHITPAFEADFRLVLFDYVGCGASIRSAYDPVRYSTLSGYATDILDICHALKLEDVILIGHSISSMIGLLAAIEEPERFRRLVMIGPNPCFVNEPGYEGGFERDELEALVSSIGKGQPWASPLASILMGNEQRPELSKELADMFCSLDTDSAERFARIAFFTDFRNKLSGLKVPAHIIQCSDDNAVPVSASEFVRTYVQVATMVRLNATGHIPQMSAPKETIDAIRSYLTATPDER